MSSDHNASSLLSTDNPLMPRLYQAAIGPLRTAYYQHQFERFDALGKPLPSWNWAAGCCTLGWMALRGLWRSAAVYAGVVLAVVALWWALDLNQLLPRPAALALALLLLLLAVLVPGLGGNALYHRTVRERTMQSLTQSRTLGEAMAQLQTQAPTPTRLQWATTGHALCWLLAAALAWGLSTMPAPGSRPATAHTGPTQQDTARALAALAPNQPAAQPDRETAATAPEATASADSTNNSTATMVTDLSTTSPESLGLTPALPTALSAAATPPPAAAAMPLRSTAEPVAQTNMAPALPASVEDKPAKAEKTDKTSAPPKSDHAKDKAREKAVSDKPTDKASNKTDKTDKASKADKAEKSNSKRAATAHKTALQPGKYYLNNGIYAQADNAKRVARQLRAAGQPVFTQPLESPKGEVTRIRVGPFDSRAQAEAAAGKIQSLKLEAQLFRHAPD